MKRFFKKSPRIEIKIFAFWVLLGLLVSIVHLTVDIFVFYNNGLEDLLIPDIMRQEIFMQSLILICFIVFGAIASRLLAPRLRVAEIPSISEAKLTATLKSTVDAIIVVDINGRITFMNPVAQEITGWPESEVRGKPLGIVFNVINEITGKNTGISIDEIIRKGTNRDLAEHSILINRDGSRVAIDQCALPVIDDFGNPGGVVITFRDVSEKRSTEIALRTSAETARALLNAPPDTSMLLDATGKILALNEAAAKTLQNRPNQLIGTCVYNYFPAELAESRKYRVNGVFESGRPARFEDERSGTVYDNTVYPVFNAEGSIDKVAVFAADITERKRVEKTLVRTQFSVNHSIDAVYWMGPDARFVDVNETACKTLGYSREELLDMTVHDIDPDFPEEVWPVHWEELRLKGSFVIESRHRTRDGRVFPVEIAINYLLIDGNEYNCAFARDITERKKAEEAIKESEEKFRNLAEQSPNMIFINSRGKIVFVNNKSVEIMGYTKEEFYDSDFDFLKLIAPEHFSIIKRNFDRHLKGEEVNPYEYDLIRKDGDRINVIINTKLIKYAGSESILGIVTDITERKKAEELREKLIADLQNAANEIKTLSGFIPICASCKKIRDDKGYWEQIETYIMERSDAEFSHGLCPECSRRLYPDL